MSSKPQDSGPLTAHRSPLTDLRAYAGTFPSQGGVEIGPYLERYAAGVPEGSAIVEIGSWLGAGTAQLAIGARLGSSVSGLGLREGNSRLKTLDPRPQTFPTIHVYDRFRATQLEVEKAKKRAGIDLQLGEDTLTRVIRSLKPFGVPIIFHKGDARAAIWGDEPIGLYVDDATKVEEVWRHAVDTFFPHFIPGKTILVLMDYHFDLEAGPRYAAQKRYMAAHQKEFEQIEDKIGGTSAAVFLFKG